MPRASNRLNTVPGADKDGKSDGSRRGAGAPKGDPDKKIKLVMMGACVFLFLGCIALSYYKFVYLPEHRGGKITQTIEAPNIQYGPRIDGYLNDGRKLAREGKEAMDKKENATAIEKYKAAAKLLQDGADFVFILRQREDLQGDGYSYWDDKAKEMQNMASVCREDQSSLKWPRCANAVNSARKRMRRRTRRPLRKTRSRMRKSPKTSPTPNRTPSPKTNLRTSRQTRRPSQRTRRTTPNRPKRRTKRNPKKEGRCQDRQDRQERRGRRKAGGTAARCSCSGCAATRCGCSCCSCTSACHSGRTSCRSGTGQSIVFSRT